MNAPIGSLNPMTPTALKAHRQRQAFRDKIAARAAALAAEKAAPASIPTEAMPAETDPPCYPVIPETMVEASGPRTFYYEQYQLAQIADIIALVAAYFGVRVVDLKSARRTANIVRPRQVAMFLCRRLTLHSLPIIGRHLGNRDHTTVLHGCRKVEALILMDLQLAAAIDHLTQILTGEGIAICPTP